MVTWIKSFSNEVKRLTGRRPVIYTTTHWWNTCTGDSRAFAANHALWLARYDSADAGALPAGLVVLDVLAVRQQRQPAG